MTVEEWNSYSNEQMLAAINNIKKPTIKTPVINKPSIKSTQNGAYNMAPTDKSTTEYKTIKCNDCGGTMQFDADKNIMCCPFCGSNKIIVESDYVNVEKYRIRNEKDVELEEIKTTAKTKDNKSRRSTLEFFGILALMAFIVAFMQIRSCMDQSEREKKNLTTIKASCSSSDFENKDYKEVKKILTSNGFNNIQSLGEDPGLLSKDKSGMVIEVTVNGTSLTSGTEYTAGDPIVIKYYK